MTERPASRSAGAWRKFGYAIAFFAGFLTIGWSIYWYVAHRLALGELEATLSREAGFGRTWSCGAMTSGGYPFSVEIDCDRFSVAARSQDRSITAQARRAVVRAPLYMPKRVYIQVHSPAEVSIDDARVDLDWRSLQVSARGLPGRWDRLSVAGADGAIRLNGNATPTRIAALQSNLRRPAHASDGILSYEISVAGIQSAIIDILLGGAEPAVVASIGSITQFDRALTSPPGDRLDQWRSAGGRLNVSQFSLQKGRFGLQADGGVGLDQTRRLDGRLELRAQNAADVIAGLGRQSGSFGLPLVGLLLRTFLTDRETGETRLAVSFENGRVGIGPMKSLMTLPPLY